MGRTERDRWGEVGLAPLAHPPRVAGRASRRARGSAPHGESIAVVSSLVTGRGVKHARRLSFGEAPAKIAARCANRPKPRSVMKKLGDAGGARILLVTTTSST